MGICKQDMPCFIQAQDRSLSLESVKVAEASDSGATSQNFIQSLQTISLC